MSSAEKILNPDYYPLYVEDVARIYKMKPGTVRLLARKKEIPCVRIQHRLRFNEKDVANAMIKTIDEAPTGWEKTQQKGICVKPSSVDERESINGTSRLDDVLGDI